MLRVLPHAGGTVGLGQGYRGREAGDPGAVPGPPAAAGAATEDHPGQGEAERPGEPLEQLADGTWLATLKAPPVDGKANAELIALVARQFGQPKSRVSIRTRRVRDG